MNMAIEPGYNDYNLQEKIEIIVYILTVANK
jgi:hypothetical protein